MPNYFSSTQQTRPISTFRILLIHVLAVPGFWLLSMLLWDATHLLLLYRYEQNTENPIAVTRSFLASHGYRPGVRISEISQNDQDALLRLLVKKGISDSRRIAGLPSTIFVSIAVFGAIGFAIGFFSRVWQYAIFVPLASLLLNNPLKQLALFNRIAIWQQLAVFALAQVGIVYISAYAGAVLSRSKLWGTACDCQPGAGSTPL